jgi:hypothetical protein
MCFGDYVALSGLGVCVWALSQGCAVLTLGFDVSPRWGLVLCVWVKLVGFG